MIWIIIIMSHSYYYFTRLLLYLLISTRFHVYLFWYLLKLLCIFILYFSATTIYITINSFLFWILKDFKINVKESFFCNYLSLLFTSDPPPPFQYYSWYSFLLYKHQFTEIYHLNYIIILFYYLFLLYASFFTGVCIITYYQLINLFYMNTFAF